MQDVGNSLASRYHGAVDPGRQGALRGLRHLGYAASEM